MSHLRMSCLCAAASMGATESVESSRLSSSEVVLLLTGPSSTTAFSDKGEFITIEDDKLKV